MGGFRIDGGNGGVDESWGVEFLEEAAFFLEECVPELETLVGMGEGEDAFGAGHGDVHEASFFFDIAGSAAIEGEDAFFDAGDEDDVEFEPFGAVDGHEFDGVFACVGLGSYERHGL